MARRCGFVATYNRGCRCRPCTDAKARAQARYRAKHAGRAAIQQLRSKRAQMERRQSADQED